MDKYFKTQRAHEEIERINVEIRRFLTYICNEHSELKQKEQEHASSSPILSFHIARYRQDRDRFNKQHIQRLTRLTQLPGFTGDLSTGVPVNGWGIRGEEGMAKHNGAEEEERYDQRMDDLDEDEADNSSEGDVSDIDASDAALAVLELSQRAD
jgi:hypothetical protein